MAQVISAPLFAGDKKPRQAKTTRNKIYIKWKYT